MEENQVSQMFEIIKELGKGSYGSTFKVKNKYSNYVFAMKKIFINNASQEDLNKIKKEATFLSNLNNEHIVKYYGSFTEKDYFNIIMEYCDGLNLREFINESKAKKTLIDKYLIYDIISDICSGIKEIHSKNIIHRDLKPENLFISGEKIKIGDFGISKQLSHNNDFTNTNIGTLAYMAPEMLKGEYNNKVDIWSLGCIIQELCTLNLCFDGDSFVEIINKIMESNYEKINQNIYGIDLQNLIDSLLEKDIKKRPDINSIIKIINKLKDENPNKQKIDLYLNNGVYEEFLIEREIQNSLEQVKMVIYEREEFYTILKKFSLVIPTFIFFSPLLLILSPFCLIKSFDNFIGNCFEAISNFYNKIIKVDKNYNFLYKNTEIISHIKNRINKKIEDELKGVLLKSEIIIYNEEIFNNKVNKIYNIIMKSFNINIIKEELSNNYNILLLGNTNVGKSTLINEFLKLEKERAEEGKGRPTHIPIDFMPYVNTKNNIQYTLYDTNGITNKGKDSIDDKISNIINEIKERLKSKNPNKFIHCIWYCFSGSNIQVSDKEFIEKLLNIYTVYTIPIIFVHCKTFSIDDSKTCKDGLKQYLLDIFGDKLKVREYLKKNYINVLAREDNTKKKCLNDESEEDDDEQEIINNRMKAFGLEKLEERSCEEIKEEGRKSAYSEYIKNYIFSFLINGAFVLIFPESNINLLLKAITKDINKYLDELKK